MTHTIGFLGGGNMGRAIMGGLIKAGLYRPDEIKVFDISEAALTSLQTDLNVQPYTAADELVKASEIVVVSVKPQVLDNLLTPLKSVITKDQLVVSIAAGVTLAHLTTLLSNKNKLVRVMPNTPALVGAGMAAIATNEVVTVDDQQAVLAIFNSFGLAKLVPEHLIDAVVGISGSGPAYVYMFIEALADGAVLEGLPRQDAYKFAAQTVYGAAKMVLETGRLPSDLKDMVCSPAGTTITGVRVLEDGGFRGLIMDTVHAAAQKNREMG
ncbi:pyrroline-5-carboxylate reductase [Lactiplantibacillus dongliensis]|uniref:Pyrroline-5-carboxylate reductase n=1 Tax=Lactiplantibacillus dongliensis TaxID=2559919 RepID=A0ABW1R4J1_9LACO|nr:pyrroline-5-carboxylate reductase [Lactiplantibacillus dongliensis]